MKFFRKRPSQKREVACINHLSHCDPLYYCAFCGWTDPRITYLANGIAGPKEHHART